MTRKQQIIGLLHRHPDEFIYMISSWNALKPEQIIKYANYLDIELLAGNSSCIWDDVLVDFFSRYFDWNVFSGKSRFFQDIDMIDLFKDRIIWNNGTKLRHQYLNEDQWSDSFGMPLTLSDNIFIPWSDSLVDKYEDRLNFRSLSSNIGVPWSTGLIDKYMDRCCWFQLSKNPSLPWSEKLIDLYFEHWDWISIIKNSSIPWTLPLFRKLYPKINLEYAGVNIDSYMNLTSNVEIVEAYANELDWSLICSNQLLPWQEHKLLKRWEERLDWYCLASNEQLFKNDPDFFYDNLHHWYNNKNTFPSVLSLNKALPWSMSFLEEFKYDWNWYNLVSNPGLPWSTKLIDKYFEKWYKPKERVEEHPIFYDPWGLIIDPAVPWEIDWIIRYEEHIDFYNFILDHSYWNQIFRPAIDDEILDVFFRLL